MPALSERTFGRFVVGAIALGFLALLILGVTGGFVLRETQRQTERVEHTYQVEIDLLRFESATERLAASRRGFLLSLDEAFVERLDLAIVEVEAMLDELAALTGDNPAQQALLAQLRVLHENHRADAERSVAQTRADPQADPRATFLAGIGAAPIVEIRALARQMIETERTLLDSRRAAQDRTNTLATIILALAGLGLVLVAAGTIYAIRRNLKELRASRHTLEGLNEMLEGAVAVRTADLQRANEEIQRFAYIVSHDLRSPLVNVMGFTAELDAAIPPMRQLVAELDAAEPGRVPAEVRLAVEEDMPEAIGFIRSSTQKMDRLINAILRLSREGRRVITPVELDLDAMLRSVVASLQHRLDEKDIAVEIEPDLPAIVSDEVAVEQILSNLVENAVKYGKPGEPGRIQVRGRTVGPRAIFEVEDNGRGIDPKDHERVFDLFRRSGAQDQPGEGIGLAHVRALAYRLGGTISCQSALGQGATFKLSMPLRYEARHEGKAA